MMKAAVLAAILLISSCRAAPHGFNLAHMQQLASNARPDRGVEATDGNGDQVTTLGELDSLHVVGIATHPTNSDKLIYADETALYEFDKKSGKSVMVAGAESTSLLASREPVDGAGSEARFKYITKVQTRASGVYVFDYDSLRIFTPDIQMVRTVMSLYDSGVMDRNPMTGTVTDAEDKVYFSNTAGFGHFVLSVAVPDGDLNKAEFVTSGPSLISSLELSGDERYLLVGDVDAGTVVRVTVGEANSERSYNTKGEPFYPGPMAALNDAEMVVVNMMGNQLETVDVNDLKEAKAACDSGCQAKLSSPLDVAVDRDQQQIYVLDSTSHPTLPTYKFTIKVVGSAEASASTGDQDPQELYKFMQHYMKQWYRMKHGGH